MPEVCPVCKSYHVYMQNCEHCGGTGVVNPKPEPKAEAEKPEEKPKELNPDMAKCKKPKSKAQA